MKVNAELGEMTRKETANYLGISLQTLENWNIPHIRLGRFSIYRKSDIEQWKESKLTGNTQEMNGAEQCKTQ